MRRVGHRAVALGLVVAASAAALPGFLAAQQVTGAAHEVGDAAAPDTPTTPREWVDAARAWRLEGEPDSALAALRRAVELGDLPPGMLELELARTAFLAGYPGDGLEAYRDGCATADEETLGEYWTDFAAVATADEQAAWEAALDLGETERAQHAACDLLEAGWGQRAARAGLGVADRLSLHYERLRHARERYWLTADDTRLGPRTRLLSNQVGRPKAAGLDDRGLVYVRLGEPDRVASFGGSGAVTRKLPDIDRPESAPERAVIQGLRISPECYHPNESWAYDYPTGTRVYHFSPLEGTANWWLLENLHDIYRCGDPTNVVSMRGDAMEGMTAVLSPAAGTRYAPPAQVAWLVMTDLYMSRVGVDPSYGAIGHRIFASGPDSIAELDGLRSTSLSIPGVLSDFSEERQAAFEAATAVLRHIPDRPAITPEAPFAYELLQFRAGAAGDERTRVWLNAVVQAEPLRAAPAEDGGVRGVRYDVRATLSLAGKDGDLYQREAVFTLRAPGELGEGTGIPARLAVEVPPGRYDASVVLRDANDEGERPVGNWATRELTVQSYAPSVPLLSDAAVAPDSGGTTQIAPGVALPISPVHETNTNRQAWLYFEAYGLSRQGDYEVEVRVEPKDEGEPYTLSYRGPPPATNQAAVRRLVRLELDESPPGEYTVRLTVTDAAGRESLPIETSLRVR